jgi:hypothetical protein
MAHIKGRKGYHQIHLDALYDLLEGRYLDASISPRPEFNERRALCNMVERNTLTGKSLYIGDRGYPCFNVFANIINAKQFFLFRLSDPYACNSFLKNTPLPEDDVFDFDHKFIISRTRSKFKDASVYKFAGKTFDLIPPGDRVSEFKIEFRVVKIKLDTGQFEYLITNLPRKKFPPDVIRELYRLRWGIETSFRQIKYNLALTSFHSKRLNFKYQEVFAKLIAFNLVALLIRSIKIKQGDTKYEYKIAVSDAIAYCWRFILTKMTGAKLINLLSRFCKTPIRPGRNYPRNVMSQRAKPLNNRF